MPDVDSPNTVVNKSYLNNTNTFPSTTVFTTSAAGRYRFSIVGIAASGFGPTFTLAYTDPDLGSLTITLPQIFVNSGSAPTVISPFFISCSSGTAISIASSSFSSSVSYNIYATVEQF